jgi:hypothetical protein
MANESGAALLRCGDSPDRHLQGAKPLLGGCQSGRGPTPFALLKQAIADQREVWDALRRMQQMAVEFLLRHLPLPPRRDRLSKKRLGLN